MVSLMAPVLYMASLVNSAVLVLSELGKNDIFFFWLMAQTFICGALFLLSLRERTELFDGQRYAASLTKRFSFVALGVTWAAVPAVTALQANLPAHLLFGAILAGTTLSSALLLQYMPSLGRVLLAGTVGGFLANIAFQPDYLSSAISLVMLTYFSGLAISTRWYFARFNRRLIEVEETAGRTREINSVLRDVGFATDTCFWSSNLDSAIAEVSNDDLLGPDLSTTIIGRDLIGLFRASPERDLLRSRIARGSEIVALELELADDIDLQARYWKLSARPVFIEGSFMGYRGSATDITALRLSEQRAAFLTEYDVTTGLLNRNSFTQAIKAHLKSDIRETYDSALIWIDLDNFKWINDTFGHGGGDIILKKVTARLEAMCEPLDIVARYGGDEFALLVSRPRTGDRLVTFIEALSAQLQKPYEYSGTDVQCGASLGLRRIEADCQDASALIKEADLALYAAKSTGRGGWKEYSETFKAQVRGQRELAHDLVSAIEDDKLILQYQPIVDARTGAVAGVEALSRWHHPIRGAISPAEFIPVAEDNGIIVALGDRVIEHAISAALDMPANTKVGINVSPLQLHSSRLLSLIQQKIEETGIDPAPDRAGNHRISLPVGQCLYPGPIAQAERSRRAHRHG